MHQPVGNGWTPSDKEEASLDVIRFMSTKGYAWIDQYIKSRQLFTSKDMCPSKPSERSHAYFVECSSRYVELIDLVAAINAIANYKTEKEEENGEK